MLNSALLRDRALRDVLARHDVFYSRPIPSLDG